MQLRSNMPILFRWHFLSAATTLGLSCCRIYQFFGFVQTKFSLFCVHVNLSYVLYLAKKDTDLLFLLFFGLSPPSEVF